MRRMDTQFADHSLKGAVVGVITYLLARWQVDPALVAVLIPLLVAALGELSKRVGVKGVADFFAKE